MLKKILLFIFCVPIFLYGKADTLPVVIKGTDAAYSGQIIKVFKYSDYITKKQQLLAVDTADQKGNFKLSFQPGETLLVFIPLGIYETNLFVEPGKTYDVILPPFQPRTKADFLNPFFQPVQMYLGIKNSGKHELNYNIADFDEQYHNYIDSNYYTIFKKPRQSNIDSVILNIENIYRIDTCKFFKQYREYKYAWLKFGSYMRDSRYVVREYFNKKPFLYQNPAYMDLFDQLFTNYLTYYMNTSEGERLYSDIALAKSPTYAKQTFSNNMVLLNDTLQELVLLKGLYDEFYNGDFPVPSLLITLDSVSYMTKVPMHKVIAENIRKKVLQARQGFPAPQFELRDAQGLLRSSKEFLVNYVYLNFISIDSYACQEDLELLKTLNEKHKSDFRIVSICIDDDFDKAVKYFKDKGYDWVLLSYRNQKSIINDYKIRVYPTYFLINPEGNLSMSPAVSPGENFEWYFFKMLQAQKRKHH